MSIPRSVLDSVGRREVCDFGVEFAERAGQELLRAQTQGDYDIVKKADGTDVTTTDKLVNKWLIDAVKLQFPSHGVLGEEQSVDPNAEVLWVVDPIDGTRYFIGETSPNNEEFTFSLALSVQGVVVFGVVLAPRLNKLYVAEQGQPTRLNNEVIKGVNRDGSHLNTKYGAMHWQGAEPDLQYLSKKFRASANNTYMGSIALQFCRVADGLLGFSAFPGHNAHDIAAGIIIVRQAGGRVTDLKGQDIKISPAGNYGALASNGLVHEDVLCEIKEHCAAN